MVSTVRSAHASALDKNPWFLRWPMMLILLVAVVALWVASPLSVRAMFPSWDVRGTFGDSFGAVNALFSGLAFGGVIFAILLQGRELQLQRGELAMTREELRRSSEAQERSSEANIRTVHFDILKLAIDDTELMEVWPSKATSETERKRDVFANLILAHLAMRYRLGMLDDGGLRAELKHLFSNAHVRQFWHRAREHRREMLAESDVVNMRFHKIAEESYAELTSRSL